MSMIVCFTIEKYKTYILIVNAAYIFITLQYIFSLFIHMSRDINSLFLIVIVDFFYPYYFFSIDIRIHYPLAWT